MNDSTAALEPSPKSWRPTSGSVERSRPTIAPTNAFTSTSSENCAAFSRSPRRTLRGLVIGRLGPLAELLHAGEQQRREDVRRYPREDNSLGDWIHWLEPFCEPAPRAVSGDDRRLMLGRRRDLAGERLHERVL